MTSRLSQFAKKFAGTFVTPAADSIALLDGMIERTLAKRSVWLVALYHRVLPAAESPILDVGLQVELGVFEQQLEFLQKHFVVLSVGEVVRRISAGQTLPERVASITFDDGYEDNYRVASPILARRGIGWSLYVTTDGLAESKPFWWDRALAILGNVPAGAHDLRFTGLAAFHRMEMVPSAGRHTWYQSVMDKLWRLTLPQVDGFLSAIQERFHIHVKDTPARISAAQIASLNDAGVEIGSHTHSHQNLALAARQSIQADILKGARLLEDICGHPIGGFAYPGGHLSSVAAAEVRNAKCEYALSVDGRLNISCVDRFRIQRVGMPNVPMHILKSALLRHLWRGSGGVASMEERRVVTP